MKKTSMRKLVLLATLFVAFLAACKKDDNVYDAGPQLTKDMAIIKHYLDSTGLPATLDSSTGISYHISEPGNGVDSIKYFGTTIDVLYKGRVLADGHVFDSTTGTTTRSFVYRDLILGWQYELNRLTKGGKMTLYIPSGWAYGTSANNGIPANSILIFDIELVNLKNPS
jgi:hypothetical protein